MTAYQIVLLISAVLVIGLVYAFVAKVEDFGDGCIAVTMFALALGLVWFIYAICLDAQSPTFALRKSEWKCTASHQESSVMTVPAGKTLAVVPTETTVCDVYTRIRG